MPEGSTSARPARKWRGLLGGEIDRLFVGAHVIDTKTGHRARITKLLDDDWVELQFEDGGLRRTRLQPADQR